jgi:hypothetical protein
VAFLYILDITLNFGYQKSQETAFLTFFSKAFTTKKNKFRKSLVQQKLSQQQTEAFSSAQVQALTLHCKGHLVISFITTPRHYYMCVNCTSHVGCFAVPSS